MKDIAQRALDTAAASGATYADVRVIDYHQRYLAAKNGQASGVRESESMGIGIRVIAGGAWGFTATDDLSAAAVDRSAAQAVEVAKVSALANKEDIQLAPEDRRIDHWESPCLIDPFAVPVSACLDLLLKVDAELRRVPGITLAESSMDFRRIEESFHSSLGSEIHQIRTQTGVGYC